MQCIASALKRVCSLLLSLCSLSMQRKVSNAAETQSKQATPGLVMASSLAMLAPHLSPGSTHTQAAKQLPAFMHVICMCKQSTRASSVWQGLSFKPHGMSHERLHLASCHAVTGR